KCNIVSGIICPLDQVSWVADCRPATSLDGGASWTLHDAPQLDIGEPGWRRPCVTRSPANTDRIWYSASLFLDAPPPQGGMGRSGASGQRWPETLSAGQPGRRGMVASTPPAPATADRLFIGRGYDFGNVAVSTDAGATFTVVCGHDNVSKSGDERCAGGSVLA